MKEQSTARGFAILSAGGMLVKVLSIVYIPLLMRIIGDEGYGLYGASYQIYTFVFVLTNSGIPVAISKLISELDAVGDYKDAVKGFRIARAMLMVIGMVMSVLLMVFASPLARAMGYKKIYLYTVYFRCLNLQGIFSRQGKYDTYSRIPDYRTGGKYNIRPDIPVQT